MAHDNLTEDEEAALKDLAEAAEESRVQIPIFDPPKLDGTQLEVDRILPVDLPKANGRQLIIDPTRV